MEGSNGLLVEIDGKMVPNYAATMVSFDEGDVVNGRVVRIDKDEVLVDIGYKSEGVIPSNELSIRKSVDPSDEVELGEEVDALVLTKEDAEGQLILSKKRARFEKAWRRIETAAESGEPVEGSVIEVVKGGLILDLGVRGFLPASLVDIRRVHNLDEFMGQTLECKVIELNRSRNNVVLSRRAVLEEERKEVREQILDRLQPGQIVEGKISNIVDFGAFVDLDGIDGLIHISELSWSHVNHPSEVVAIGDDVRIKVLDIDRDRQRISLGLKQTQEDPWQRVVSTHRSGDVLEGTVTKVVAFGAFVEILPGVEGLVHISELADHHVESPSEVVEPGAKLDVKILEIDEERRRLSLSIKRVEGQNMPMEDLGAQIAEAEGEAPADEAEDAPAQLADGPDAEAESPEEALAEDAATEQDEAAAEDEPAAEAEEAPAEEPEAELRPPPRRPSPVPLTIGLTGGIAAGKSEALAAFERLGAATISSDAVVHELLDSEPLLGRLAERWGDDVVAGGRVDRARVGEIVFAEPDQLSWLESQVHPLVGERIGAWLAALPADARLAVVEVPLLLSRAWTASSTRPSPSSPPTRSAAPGPRPRGTRWSANARRASSPRRRRRGARPT